ncbi:MAG: AI-2E family transporter [Lachnospiraceae bacterium]|nr:AI-2E family transporter [Lachnospiraceae bacterium]
MKKLKELLEKKWFSYTFAACIAVLLYVTLTHFSGIGSFFAAFKDVVSPVFCGMVMAYLMNPVCKFFEKSILRKIKKDRIRHIIAVIITVALVVLLVALLFIALIPSLVQSVSVLISNIPIYLTNLESNLDKLSESLSKFGINVNDIERSVEKSFTNFISGIPENMGTVFSTSVSVGSSLFNLVIGFILAVYFIADKENFKSSIRRIRHALLTDKKYASHTAFWKKCHEILIRYIGFDVLDGVIVGVINAIFMVIAGMPYVPLISVVVGVTNLVPTFGPMIGAAIGAFILVLADPMMALIFLIFTLVLQLVDGYVLKPKLFGGSLGVPAAWVPISIVVGGKLFGVAGIILAIPFAAIVVFTYEELFMPLLLEHKAKKEKIEAVEEKSEEG